MIYKTKNGVRTRVTKNTNFETAYDFEVYGFGADKKKTVIDRYTLSGDEATHHIANLQAANEIRFAAEFGGLPETSTVNENDVRKLWADKLRTRFANPRDHDHASGGGECGACGALQAADLLDPTTAKHPADEYDFGPTGEVVPIFRYSVDVVAVTPEGDVLLIRRGWDPFKGHWALPGGGVNQREQASAAAARELFEETKVRVDPGDLVEIGVFDHPDRDPRARQVSVAYFVVVPSGTTARAGDDADDARWWGLDSLPELAFDHKDIIAAARRTLAS